MKEPLRLCDPRSQSSPELRALLGVAEPPRPLPAAARERVRRALGRRAAATERKAVCWSHAFGLALAVATCVTWLLPARHEPDAARSIARTPSARAPAGSAGARGSHRAVAARSPTAGAAPAPAPGQPRHVVREASPAATVAADADQVAAAPRAASAGAEHAASARRAAHGRRWATGPARSRKRIEALVDEILKPEAQLLDRARREVARDPEQALALIDTYRRRHPDSALPAPTAVAEVDALRRLGRFEEALAKARALLESSRKPYYADEMAERFALLDL